MSRISRRQSIRVLGAITTLPAIASAASANQSNADSPNSFESKWHNEHDRIWLGADHWANPMEDWRIINGAAEVLRGGGRRNVHLLTHRLVHADRPWQMSVTVSQTSSSDSTALPNLGVGFHVGVRSELNETKSNCFSPNGIAIGIADGRLRIGSAAGDEAIAQPIEEIRLHLSAVPNGAKVTLTLEATDREGQSISTLKTDIAPEMLLGNVALVNNFTPANKPKQSARHRFSDWHVSGEAFEVNPDARFGPILWAMYSLSDSRTDEGFVMKLSALTPPLGDADNDEVELKVQKNGQWQSFGTATLDHDAWTATFRIPSWDASQSTPYELVYQQSHVDGTTTTHSRTGTIQANPTGRPLRLAALTCQKDYAFPYAPVVENLNRLKPDLIFFSGDQIYEDHGGYGLIREPAEAAIVNYLRKYYMFGWAFAEPMRHAPTLCIPDDHDVFQGNYWGEGGAAMRVGPNDGASSKGGYVEPVRMVNAVHKSCASHHPDLFDPTPAKQDMSVYYGDMVYGGVSFAILGDRQFKSGPERVDTGKGRADHVLDPDFDTAALDQPGLELLGERQETFLRAWGADWRGAKIKVLLSQTLLANTATHHGAFNGYLKADLDSGGWPQTPRNRAVALLRDAKALHINGDQHLTSLVQYGIEKQRDATWSFCVPAIAAGYPRWWRPDDLGMPHDNRPEHGLPNTGEYLDGFGNLVYVYAVGNPVVEQAKNRYDRAHEKASGFGWVLIDPEKQTYEIHSYRFLVDATDNNPDNEFPGWPKTITVV